MAVLNTTSPTAAPRAPMERPWNTVPSARTRAAFSGFGMWIRRAGSFWRLPARLKQGLYAQDVRHTVEAGRPGRQPLRRAQGARGVGGAALRAHRDLDALAAAGEDHRVLPDDVAAADGMEADLPARALAGVARASV